MTYNRAPEYTLGDKMKKQFGARGAAVRGMRASTTSELLHRAKLGQDPRVNCSEEAFFENYRNLKHTTNNAKSRNGAEKSHRTVHAANNFTKNQNRTKTADRRRREPKFEPITPETEIRISKDRISLSFILILVVGAMMFMALIFSVSEVYRSTSEISQLESQLTDLQSQAELLEIKLEEKNDVELIEQIASEKLGMVGGESVQRRYITLSGGEHIEVYEEAEEEKSDGVVFSSIFSSLGKFFDRFN